MLPETPYYLENAWILVNKVNNLGASIFLEIETPNGGAARIIASNTNNVKVYSINPWEGDHQYQQFLSNVKQENTGNTIIPIRMSSTEAAEALNILADVIYIDSSIPESIEKKILYWVTHLSPNGILVGNNFQWWDVKLAVVNTAAQLSLEIDSDTNYWFLRKP